MGSWERGAGNSREQGRTRGLHREPGPGQPLGSAGSNIQAPALVWLGLPNPLPQSIRTALHCLHLRNVSSSALQFLSHSLSLFCHSIAALGAVRAHSIESAMATTVAAAGTAVSAFAATLSSSALVSAVASPPLLHVLMESCVQSAIDCSFSVSE
jgi:hypothetical protein